MDKRKTFFFTFGSRGQVFNGGWIKIYADTLKEAQEKFKKRYGDSAYSWTGHLNYACSYQAEQFKTTPMYWEGNFGIKCHEVIE